MQPLWDEMRSRIVPKRTKTAQRRLKTAQETPKTAQEAHMTAQEATKTAHEAPKTTPRGPQRRYNYLLGVVKKQSKEANIDLTRRWAIGPANNYNAPECPRNPLKSP